MFAKLFIFFVTILMLISPTLPHLFGLPAVPAGQELNLEERFELTWSDEFDGDALDSTKWQTNWWITERKGGYWHDDMVSVKDGTEIDIFESMHYKNVKWGYGDAVEANIHFDGYGDAHQSDTTGAYFANNPYEDNNTYGLEWNENEYIFYINGVETNRLSTGGVSQNPEYLLLSCEVRDENGIPATDNKGVGKMSLQPDETAEFIVDYVRVYQYK